MFRNPRHYYDRTDGLLLRNRNGDRADTPKDAMRFGVCLQQPVFPLAKAISEDLQNSTKPFRIGGVVF
jgi:hypothetical protein